MRAAVINDTGEVVNIIVADAAVDILPGFTLVNCTDEVSFRHVWTGTEFVPNAELQAEIDELQAEIDAELAALEALAWEETV